MRAPTLPRRAAVYTALCTVAVTQPLLQLYGRNLAIFTTAKFSGWVIVWFGLFVALVPPAVLVVADVLLTRVLRRDAEPVHASLVLLGFWVLAMLLLRGVSLGPWQVDALFALVPAVLLTLAYLRWDVVHSWVALMSPLSVLVVALFVSSTSALVWPPSADASRSAVSVVSPDPTIDVLWIQLDEAPLFPLLKSDGTVNAARFPGFARLASVTTWYRNVLSVSQHTSVAVPAMLTGSAPDYSRQPIVSDYPNNLFSLMRNRMDLDITEDVTSFCSEDWCRPGTDAAAAEPAVAPEPGRQGFTSFLRDALVVTGHKLLPAGLRSRLPAIDETWGSFGQDDETVTAPVPDSATSGGGGETLVGHAARIEKLRALVRRQVAATAPTLRFAHILLPHRPWVLAPDARKSADPVMDTRPVTMLDRRRDAYQSFLNQYIALDREIGAMVDALTASPRWARTMLIVTADHGLTFIPGLSYRDRINSGVPESLDDIYRVPLFVHYPGSTGGTVDDCTASVLDVVATIEATTGVTAPWRTQGGDLQRSCPERSSRTVTWPKGSAEVSTGVDALLKRVAYYGRWINSDGNVDDIYRSGRAGGLLGTEAPAGAPLDTTVTWTMENGDEFSDVGTGEYSHVPTRAVGHIMTSRDMKPGEELLVAVDGVFIAEAPEVTHVKAGERAYFSASVMSRLVLPGSHTVTVWLAAPRADGSGFDLSRIAN